MGLAQERRQHRDHQQQQQPGYVDRERRGQGDQGDQVLQRRQQHRKQADAADRLPPGPLQLVVDLRVLELLQVEIGGVLHELHAGPVGEQVSQEALEQGRYSAQSFAHQGDAELDADQDRETAPRRPRLPPAPR